MASKVIDTRSLVTKICEGLSLDYIEESPGVFLIQFSEEAKARINEALSIEPEEVIPLALARSIKPDLTVDQFRELVKEVGKR